MMEPFDQMKSSMADRYALERKIGAGRMADVYLAHDVRHNRKVAIKVMHRELAMRVGVDRFLREIERPFFDLYRRTSDASRPAEALVTGSYDRCTGAVSRDGRLFAFVLAVPGGGELWTVPLSGRPEATRYFANGSNLGHPTLSPDGRWMAYDSDESGQGIDVFIQSFPDPQLKRVKVSPAHGSEPMWTRGGRELVYRDGDNVMAVSIDLATGSTGPPRVLFTGPYPDNPEWTRPRSDDVTPDGERFLMTRLSDKQPQPRIAVVLNWFEELRARVPR